MKDKAGGGSEEKQPCPVRFVPQSALKQQPLKKVKVSLGDFCFGFFQGEQRQKKKTHNGEFEFKLY